MKPDISVVVVIRRRPGSPIDYDSIPGKDKFSIYSRPDLEPIQPSSHSVLEFLLDAKRLDYKSCHLNSTSCTDLE